MNKSWLNIKKYFITFTLILSMTIMSLFSGCFSYSEDGEGLNDILYGVRMTYSKANLQESSDNITSSKDEDYAKDLITQYLNISVEVLTSLCSKYGKGVTDFSLVANNIPSDYGQVTITEIKFCESLDSSSENYLKMISESGRWEWANNLSSSASQNRFASDFCSSENLFKMQAALYSINMGIDCSGPNYNGNDTLINDSPSLETIKKFANDFRVTHSGLIETEQELFKDFILNNVIGSAYYQEYASDIENMVKEIFAQTVGTGKNGEEIYKYPVVVSAMVKDYNIKDIAIDSDEDEDKDVDYFKIGRAHV